MATNNRNLEVVLVGWIDARRRSDLETIERHLHPDVVWQGLREDLVCVDRRQVLQTIRNAAGRLPQVDGIELTADGDQVLFGVRSPELIEVAGEVLEGEIYNVFTIQDGLIVRMDEFRTREAATEAMREQRQSHASRAEAASPVPAAPVTDLIPFVHVADVERSIAFYELLGFVVGDTYHPGDRLEWAALETQDAKLMLTHADEPVAAARQGVLFYLYAYDLHALQQHLRAHGRMVGAICDGRPGPKQEMRLRDPDGYVLMIAQIDDDTRG